MADVPRRTLWQTAGRIVTIPALAVKLVLATPLLGAALKQALHVITNLAFGVIGCAIEGVLGELLGIWPTKHIRLCVIIARDAGGPVATPADIQPLIDRAVQIFRDEANLRLSVALHDGTDGPRLEAVKCGLPAWLQDLGATGTACELSQGRHDAGHAFASLLGVGSPIYAFAVDSIGDKNGCSLWWLSNYVTFVPPAGACCRGGTHLAHEIGHCCGLSWHAADGANLMYARCRDPGRDRMSRLQKAIVRGSKYATYFQAAPPLMTPGRRAI